MPQQNDFSSLSIEEKVINIKRRINDMQLKLRLQNTLKSATSDLTSEYGRSTHWNDQSETSSHTTTSKNQHANELNDLKAKLLGRPK